MPPLLRLARPHQYVKNGFVLVGPIFANDWTLGLGVKALFAFIAFCLMASAIYVANDIIDVEVDRAHPTKRNRPIASGEISIGLAWRFALALALGALALGASLSIQALELLVFYGGVQYGYSMWWKHIVVLDVFLISVGFMVRIFMGTFGLGIRSSSWLVLCGLMVTLFLGFAKRRSELVLFEHRGPPAGQSTRKVLDDYSKAMIEQFMSISAACAILAYSLYTVAPDTVARHHTSYLFLSVPFVIYGIFRYLYLLHEARYGTDAARELFQDRHLLVTAIAWLVVVILVLVVRP